MANFPYPYYEVEISGDNGFTGIVFGFHPDHNWPGMSRDDFAELIKDTLGGLQGASSVSGLRHVVADSAF